MAKHRSHSFELLNTNYLSGRKAAFLFAQRRRQTQSVLAIDLALFLGRESDSRGRLRPSGEVWCGLVKNFRRLFYAIAGRPHEIDAHRSRDGQHRYKTKRDIRELMEV